MTNNEEIINVPKIKIKLERYDEKRKRYKCNIIIDGKKTYFDLPSKIYELLKIMEQLK